MTSPAVAPRRRFVGLTVAERLMAYTEFDTNGGCWLWTAALYPDGYGEIGVRGKLRAAHRQAWEEFCGPIPAGLQVLHHCDVRSCINPAHLFLGTNADNVADRVAKGRTRVGKGTANRHAKLTEQQVAEIFARIAAGERNISIAADYPVSSNSICNMRNGWCWKDHPKGQGTIGPTR